MPTDLPSKVTAAHLRKDAYLHFRQSTIKQVLTNTESALRQYDLKSRAIALGWSTEQVIVIDIGQGQSGASAADREGFQRLVAEVGMGRSRPSVPPPQRGHPTSVQRPVADRPWRQPA